MSGEDYNAEKTQNESPMAELANEADNFDPEKAEKARKKRADSEKTLDDDAAFWQ